MNLTVIANIFRSALIPSGLKSVSCPIMAVGRVIPRLILVFIFSLVLNKHKKPSDFESIYDLERYRGQSIFNPVEYFCTEIFSLPWEVCGSHLEFKTKARRRV